MASLGYRPQEPHLNEAKDVTGNVMEGMAEKKAKLYRYNKVALNYSDETADEMSKLQDEIDAQTVVAAESTLPIVPPAERFVGLIEAAKGVGQADVGDGPQGCAFFRAHVYATHPGRGVVHVPVLGCDVEVA